MLFFILKCFYLVLPGIFANSIAPLLKNKLKILAVPIDLNKKINEKPLFGKNKTYRGFIAAIAAAIFIAYLQSLAYGHSFFKELSFVDYSNWLVLGFLMGFGVMFGDLVGSFFKRRAGIESGKSFVPVDQLSSPIGVIVFISFVYVPPWPVILVSVALAFVLHVLLNHAGYYLGVRPSKW